MMVGMSVGTTSAPVRPPSSRILSVDVLRGLTIALMIVVNDPGDWAHVYSQLDHSPWNGFTLTDFVFPNFLFLVGVSLILSLKARIMRSPGGLLDGPTRRALAMHILRRAALLFAIKMLLTAFPHFHWTHLRLYGVLTRIALCYLVAGLICLVTQRARTLAGIVVCLLVGYWMLLRFVPVPGLGLPKLADAIPTHAIPILDPQDNLAAWLDRAVNAFTQRWLHTGALYNRTSDPEGLLSTLPALATTLIGSLTGLWIGRVRASRARLSSTNSRNADTPVEPTSLRRSSRISRKRCVTGMVFAGGLCLATSIAWSIVFPLNKNLWTSSYVLFAAGCSLVLLGLLFLLTEILYLDDTPVGRVLLYPWLVFGSNALTAFVLSNFVVELLLWIKVPATPHAVSAWLWIYAHLFAWHGSTRITSLAFALVFTVFCWVPNYLLYRRRIFLKL